MRASLSGSQFQGKNGFVVYTGTEDGAADERLYVWNSTSTDADDGDLTIKLDDTTTGRLKAVLWPASHVNFTPAGTGAVTRSVEDKLRESITPEDKGAKNDGATDDLAALQLAFAESKSSGKALRLLKSSNYYRISGKLLVTSFLGDIISEGAQIRLDADVNDTALEFEAGSPNIEGVLRIYRGVNDTSYATDWKSGNFNDTVGLKENSSARINSERLDIQGFYRGRYTYVDGNDSAGSRTRMTECNLGIQEFLNNKIGWHIKSDNSGYFTDVSGGRIRCGGGSAQGLPGAIGILAESGTGGSLQSPKFDSVNISDYSAAVAITGATQANPCVISIGSDQGIQTGDKILIQGVVGMTEINDVGFTVTRLSPTTFSLDGIDSSAYGAYVSGGQMSGVGVWYDSPRTIALGDGYWEANEVDVFFPVPTNPGSIKPALFGFNVDEQFLTIVNPAGKPFSSSSFSMGARNVGDSLCSVAMYLQSGTDVQVGIFDSNSAGSPSSYNSRLYHALVSVTKGGSATASTTEGTVQYDLNAGGTELTVTLPGAPVDRVLCAVMNMDGSAATKTLTVRADLGSATLASNTIKIELLAGASAYDMSTLTSSNIIFQILMIRRKIAEINP
jgi:hypothetical protein